MNRHLMNAIEGKKEITIGILNNTNPIVGRPMELSENTLSMEVTNASISNGVVNSRPMTISGYININMNNVTFWYVNSEINSR